MLFEMIFFNRLINVILGHIVFVFYDVLFLIFLHFYFDNVCSCGWPAISNPSLSNFSVIRNNTTSCFFLFSTQYCIIRT